MQCCNYIAQTYIGDILVIVNPYTRFNLYSQEASCVPSSLLLPAQLPLNDVNGCSKADSLRSENREHGQSNVVCWRGMKHGVPTHFVCFQPSSLLLVPTLRHFSLYSHATHKCSRVMITFVRV